jgi:2-hydroxy-6-oxonona-2,4-dienedioate hydrolase
MSAKYMQGERPAMVLVNGLAEQEQTWFANVRCWQEHFEVHQPDLTVAANEYSGSGPQSKFSIDQLVESLRRYIDRSVGRRVHLVANSMGGKVAIEFAVRYPEMIHRLVLLAPSGLTRHERLPILSGTRPADSDVLVRSVFHNPEQAPEHLFEHYRKRLKDRIWRRKLLQIVRATGDHHVRDIVGLVRQPTLVILGADDRIVDPIETAQIAQRLPRGRIKLLLTCGHAPQVERAGQVNRLVVRFLLSTRPVGVNRPIGTLN